MTITLNSTVTPKRTIVYTDNTLFAFQSIASGTLPWTPPSTATLRASPRKVKVHYFAPFPLSIDNQPRASTYYITQLFNVPGGEASPDFPQGKHFTSGGYMKDLPQQVGVVGPASTYPVVNYTTEIAKMIAHGIDGVFWDVLTPSDGSQLDVYLDEFLAAATAFPGFEVTLLYDTGVGALLDPAALNAFVTKYASHPNMWILGGKPVFGVYNAQAPVTLTDIHGATVDANWWHNWVNTQPGITFMPGFAGLDWNANFPAFASFSQATFTWGVSDYNSSLAIQASIASLRAAFPSLYIVSFARFQDSRTSEFAWWEGNGPNLLRQNMQAALAGGANAVQGITWNDYTETQMANSLDRDHVPLIIFNYEIIKYKTGSYPVIETDTILGIHRIAPADASPQIPPQGQVDVRFGSTPSDDNMYLQAYLAHPGKLAITANGVVLASADVTAGVQQIKAPLSIGFAPTFTFTPAAVTNFNLRQALLNLATTAKTYAMTNITYGPGMDPASYTYSVAPQGSVTVGGKTYNGVIGSFPALQRSMVADSDQTTGQVFVGAFDALGTGTATALDNAPLTAADGQTGTLAPLIAAGTAVAGFAPDHWNRTWDLNELTDGSAILTLTYTPVYGGNLEPMGKWVESTQIAADGTILAGKRITLGGPARDIIFSTY